MSEQRSQRSSAPQRSAAQLSHPRSAHCHSSTAHALAATHSLATPLPALKPPARITRERTSAAVSSDFGHRLRPTLQRWPRLQPLPSSAMQLPHIHATFANVSFLRRQWYRGSRTRTELQRYVSQRVEEAADADELDAAIRRERIIDLAAGTHGLCNVAEVFLHEVMKWKEKVR